MMCLIKIILSVWGTHKLYKAIIKEDFGCLYDATLMFAFVFLVQPII